MITVDKKEQLIEYIIQDIILYMVEDFKVEYDDAMRLFFASQTYMKLTDKETALYYESSAYIYELFQEEQKTGKLMQGCE